MSPESTAATPPWSDLLPELLGWIAASCPNPADRVRFRSVCRSWRSAVRHHCPRSPPTPWVVLPDGSFSMLTDDESRMSSVILPHGIFLKPSDGGPHRLALPESTTCVGSTDGWLALRRRPPSSGDTFLMHSPFSGTTVPLPGVDAICAMTPRNECFKVVKVLMRSSSAATADMIVAVMTQSVSYPLLLCLPGKGAWAADPHMPPFTHVIDVAFLGDKLYGITKVEDLFSFDLSLVHDDHQEAPVITRRERVIRHPLEPYYDPFEHIYGYNTVVQWSDAEDEDEDEDHQLENDHDELDPPFREDEEDSEEEEDADEEEEEDDSYFELDAKNLPPSVDFRVDEANKDGFILTVRYLNADESRGKLIMVRQETQWPDSLPTYTRKVEVFEADTEAGAWVPVPRELGLGGGRALFLSSRFSKLVCTSEYGKGAQELDDDSIYFVDTGKVFHVRSATIGPARWCLDFWDPSHPTWVFPPGLVA